MIHLSIVRRTLRRGTVMKKLRLQMDELTVESYPTTEPELEERGTVHGHDTKGCPTPDTFCPPETWGCSYDVCTLHESCDFTCRCWTAADCVFTT
jgi:hypothetical protein